MVASMRIGRSLQVGLLQGPELYEAISLLSKLTPENIGRFELERIGARNDGGYMIPASFPKFDALFSPGVGGVVDFDLYFADRGVEVFQLDGSVDGPPAYHSKFHFLKLWLGSEGISLAEWVGSTSFRTSRNLGLQMDIEGSEWSVLQEATPELLSQFSLIAIELHDLDEILTEEGKTKRAVLLKLLELFEPVFSATNNFVRSTNLGGFLIPPVVEVTFVRRGTLAALVTGTNQQVPPEKNAKWLPRSVWRIE
jgi:hypothetical protein